MPLGTLDRDPPPFFRQGPSALSKLAVFSALAFFLMVADARFKVMQPLRVGLAAVLYPVQWLAMQPIQLVQGGGQYFSSLRSAQTDKDLALKKLGLQAQRANQVEQLALENQRLRKLLGLRDRLQSGGMAAQVLYDAADPYTRKVVIDRGMTDKVNLGSPVVDEQGVIGQVTRVYPLVSEVTLLTDRDHAIPVLNTRTGARGVAFGDVNPCRRHGVAVHGGQCRCGGRPAHHQWCGWCVSTCCRGAVESGRRVDAVFARIYCVPLGLVAGASHVMVLEPVTAQIAARPVPEPVVATGKRGCQMNAQARRGVAMIMRPGQQLLLPASPLFIWSSLLVAMVINMTQNMGLWGRAWVPDVLAVVLVFWTVHQPLRDWYWCLVCVRAADGRAPGCLAGAACAGLYGLEFLCDHHASAVALVYGTFIGGAGVAAVLPHMRWKQCA